MFAFCHFPMLFNGNLSIEKLGGGMYGRLYGRTYGRTYRRTYGHKEIHPCVLQDIGPLGPLPKKEKKKAKETEKKEKKKQTRTKTERKRFILCKATVIEYACFLVIWLI